MWSPRSRRRHGDPTGVALCLGFYALDPTSRDTVRLMHLQRRTRLLAVSVNDRVGNNAAANHDHHINASWSTARGCAAILQHLRRILDHWGLELRAVFVEWYYIPPSYHETFYNAGMARLLQQLVDGGAEVHVMVMPGSDVVSGALTMAPVVQSAWENPLFAATKDARVPMVVGGVDGTGARDESALHPRMRFERIALVSIEVPAGARHHGAEGGVLRDVGADTAQVIRRDPAGVLWVGLEHVPHKDLDGRRCVSFHNPTRGVERVPDATRVYA